jgi:hypothetical protein
MKTKIFLIAFLVSAIFSFNSCSKFEEGPGISLKSKKARLANTWAFETITDLNTGDEMTAQEFFDISGEDIDYEVDVKFKFDKEGTFEVVYAVMTFEFTVPGTWEFVGDTGLKLEIDLSSIDPEAENQIMEMNILRLASKELWLEYEDSGEKYQMNMIPSE